MVLHTCKAFQVDQLEHETAERNRRQYLCALEKPVIADCLCIGGYNNIGADGSDGCVHLKSPSQTDSLSIDVYNNI